MEKPQGFWLAFRQATHLNGGEPVLQKRRTKVSFDPTNMQHLKEADKIFAGQVAELEFILVPPFVDTPTMLTRCITRHFLDLRLGSNRDRQLTFSKPALPTNSREVTPSR